jgi:hypothetical protein
MKSYHAYIGSLAVEPYLSLIRKGLEYIGFGKLARSDTRIFIKPNLTYPTFRPGVMTTIGVLETPIGAVRD